MTARYWFRSWTGRVRGFFNRKKFLVAVCRELKTRRDNPDDLLEALETSEGWFNGSPL